MLSCVGGLLGIGIAVLGEPVVSGFLTNGQSDFTLHADLNWRVLFFACGLSLVTGVVFGIAPAMRSTRRVLLPAVHDARSTPLPGSSRRARLTRAFVVLQMGATLVLLVVSGLFARTLAGYAALDLGFNPNGVLTVMVNAMQAGFDPDGAITIYDDLRRRFAAMPGVAAVGMSESALMGDGTSATTVVPAGSRLTDSVSILNVGAGFLATMEVPLARGREIGEIDTRPGAKPVVVVSEAYARAYFGDATPRLVARRDRGRDPAPRRDRAADVAADGAIRRHVAREFPGAARGRSRKQARRRDRPRRRLARRPDGHGAGDGENDP